MNRKKCIPAAVCLAAAMTLGAFAAEIRLSPAFEALEKKLEVKSCGIVGNPIAVSKDDLDSAFGRKVELYRVSALPEKETGTVYVGALPAVCGQILSRNSLDAFVFEPTADEPVNAAFAVSDAASGVTVTCRMHLLDGENTAPTAKAMTMTTYRDVGAMGYLPAVDPDDDALTFSVEQYPSHGTVKIDKDGGYVRYTPKAGYTGKDVFSYAVTDVFGHTSLPAKVEIKVSRPPKGCYFNDLDGHWAKCAAMRVSAEGLMNRDASFDPNGTMTRGDFLAMALICAGKEKEIAYTPTTDFADDAQIPLPVKSYAAYAKANGIIDGIADEAGNVRFDSASALTRAEAAVIVSRILHLPPTKDSISVFADASAIPVWASDAMAGVSSAGIFKGRGGGRMCPSECVTRAETAQILCEILDRS